MSKIIYGVSGEGSGHAIRSREVLRHLVGEGHQVHVVTYGRARALLETEFSTTKIFGLHLDYRHNVVRYLPTIWKNAIRAPDAVDSIHKVSELFSQFKPDVVCTDFEPLTVLTAVRFGVPILSIDNIHHVLYRAHRVPWRYRRHRLVAEAVIKLLVPMADSYVVTSLAAEKVKKNKVFFVPPIIRPSILEASPYSGNHILVYDSFGDDRLPKILQKVNGSFYMYGYAHQGQTGNLHFKSASDQGFREDLISCRAVIGTGGFTLISESLALKKPYLALPIGGQFEQIDNGLEIERLGYGQMLKNAAVVDIVKFIDQMEVYRNRLESYAHPGNKSTMATITRLIHEIRGGKVIHQFS